MAARLAFAPPFQSYMVLQQAPSRATVHGYVHLPMNSAGRHVAPRLWLRIGSDAHVLVDFEVQHLELRTLGRQSRLLHAETWATWLWRAILPPVNDSLDAHGQPLQYTLKVWRATTDASKQRHAAHADGLSAELSNVSFGDVWLCIGQSNMQHPIQGTLDRNDSYERIRAGRYRNIRLLPRGYHLDSEVDLPPPRSNASAPWVTALSALGDGSLQNFCAVCFYFAEALSERFLAAHRAPPTLGLMCSAAGGSHIERFFPQSRPARSFCYHTYGPMGGAGDLPSLYPRHVQPFLGVALKGWVFYQGENNLQVNAVSGNSHGRYGYGCELPALVRVWRELWSDQWGGAIRVNTTLPEAPFGIVTVHTNAGWWNARDFGGFRWAQTANFGTVPNAMLPNAFLAQAYDLPDPWEIRPLCAASWKCCPTPQGTQHSKHSVEGRMQRERCANATRALPGGPAACTAFCLSRQSTPIGYLGNLHSRQKRAIGERLAQSAYAQTYGGRGAGTGPTIAGCSLVYPPASTHEGSHEPHQHEPRTPDALVVRFNKTLLRGEELVWRRDAPNAFEVLVQPEQWCLQPMVRCRPKAVVESPEKKDIPHVEDHPVVRSMRCAVEDREWFCPRALQASGPSQASATDIAQAGGLGEDFAYVSGPHLAARPERGDVFEAGWREVTILDTGPGHAVLDLRSLQLSTAPSAVRYMWGATQMHSNLADYFGEKLCCRDEGSYLGISKPCLPGACALKASGGLPANPFIARIRAGRCECLAPQVCNES